jgi:hypothetical protein
VQAEPVADPPRNVRVIPDPEPAPDPWDEAPVVPPEPDPVAEAEPEPAAELPPAPLPEEVAVPWDANGGPEPHAPAATAEEDTDANLVLPPPVPSRRAASRRGRR